MPMAVEQKLEIDGEVTEALPNLLFRVKLENDHELLAHLAGKMRRFRIRVLPGDRVRVEVSPYDLNHRRIVYRFQWGGDPAGRRRARRPRRFSPGLGRASAPSGPGRVSCDAAHSYRSPCGGYR